MDERLWTTTLTAAQLEARLAPPRDAARFAILESLTDIDFPAPTETIALAQWQQGRIFGEKFELRWERQGKNYRVWLAGEGDAAGFEELPQVKDAHSTDASCYMWGPDERRIARRMEYRALPKGEGRVCLFRREFRDDKGALVFYRYLRMEWEDKP